ncbi:hypothetical protein FKW77_009382 [Venturia effusa]|uniref:Major facilitator superfamily (MFS) profile domain-containing protein n=1 Tax=Venturia effusa TaxID=50376 RepID=A0A517L439_9PEZI|nr:hypothetical protein FKW77_009382 [Venturia effusa]
MSHYRALAAADGEERSRESGVETFGRTNEKEASTRYMIVLTCSTGGLQVVWSLIMSNGTPFLITLGLPESLTALVWAPLQAGIRALIVDNCPARQQVEASAWASRITGAGNMIGYLFGFIPVHSIMPLIDMSQFAWLCIVASLILSSTVGITLILIQEKDPRLLPAPLGEGLSFVKTVKHIVWSAQAMPYSVFEVCKVQFFAWMGWFGYLFYISSYVGNLYAAPRLAEDLNMSSTDKGNIVEDAVRLGSLASLVFATFALTTSILLPVMIERFNRGAGQKPTTAITTAWTYLHLLFSLSMFSTIFVRSETTAIVLAAFVGISWAGTLWIPFALIGKDVAARNEINAHVLEGELEPAQQDQAGAIMGLHNSAISAPQIIAALASGIILWLVPRDGLGWVMRFGGCSTLAAAWFASKMEAR